MAMRVRGGAFVADNDKPPKGWTKAQWDQLTPRGKDRVLKENLLPSPDAGNFKSSVFRIGEGIYGVEDEIARIPDPGVKAAFAKLKQAHQQFQSVLDKRVAWD